MTQSIPRFDLPIRYVGGKIATVEQGSEKDILNCVEATVRTTIGEREEIPDFGIDNYTFARVPLPVQEIIENLRRWVPDADTVIQQTLDFLDSLHTELEIDVAKRSGLNA